MFADLDAAAFPKRQKVYKNYFIPLFFLLNA